MSASDAPGDENDGGRECRYELYTPGTDLSSADYGMVQILVQDTWPDVLLDGKHDAADSRQAFDHDRDSAPEHVQRHQREQRDRPLLRHRRRRRGGVRRGRRPHQ